MDLEETRTAVTDPAASAPWWRRVWPWMVPLTAVASAAIIYVAARPASIPMGGGAAVVTDQAAPAPLRFDTWRCPRLARTWS